MATNDRNGHRRARPRVLIAGGGVAALEAVLALRALAGGRLSLTVLAPGEELLYRPVTVAEPFGRGEARSYRLDDLLAEQDVEHIHDALELVEAPHHTVVTASGDRIRYETLVVAVGARARSMLPGAIAFGGRTEVFAMREILRELIAGEARSVAFALGSAGVWPLPLYELTILTASYLREHRCDARVTLVTPEETPLDLFGPEAARVIEPMLSRLGVVLRCNARPSAVHRGELQLLGGGGVTADRVVTLPTFFGPHLNGLPSDDDGFIPVDGHGRVPGVPDVYAAGDITAFPFKQGGLATQQADVVAAHIAHAAGAPVPVHRFAPVLRGLLITPGAPVYLRSEPQRLNRHSSVAIDERRVLSLRDLPAPSAASDQALWWPPAKIAGRYLAPYLATTLPHGVTTAMADRTPVSGQAVSDEEFDDAIELALLLADGDARWGDYGSALAALDAAEALRGTLPPEYESKRRLWLGEQRAE